MTKDVYCLFAFIIVFNVDALTNIRVSLGCWNDTYFGCLAFKSARFWCTYTFNDISDNLSCSIFSILPWKLGHSFCWDHWIRLPCLSPSCPTSKEHRSLSTVYQLPSCLSKEFYSYYGCLNSNMYNRYIFQIAYRLRCIQVVGYRCTPLRLNEFGNTLVNFWRLRNRHFWLSHFKIPCICSGALELPESDLF